MMTVRPNDADDYYRQVLQELDEIGRDVERLVHATMRAQLAWASLGPALLWSARPAPAPKRRFRVIMGGKTG